MNNSRRHSALDPAVALAFVLSTLLVIPWTAVRAEQPQDLYEMEVLGLAATPTGDQHSVLLRGKGGKGELTLFVGPLEAQSIAVPLQQIKLPRPLTHDLTLSLLAAFHSRLKQVIISDVKDNTFYATLYIETNGKEITVDSRPSDAIALALRAGTPIYANSRALNGANPNQSSR